MRLKQNKTKEVGAMRYELSNNTLKLFVKECDYVNNVLRCLSFVDVVENRRGMYLYEIDCSDERIIEVIIEELDREIERCINYDDEYREKICRILKRKFLEIGESLKNLKIK